jgi:multidrug efflux pump subunit AcrB
MTALTFILGVIPLVSATGAGSAGRRSMGTAVFGGMLVMTALGVFMVPVFYVVVQRLAEAIGSLWRRKPGRGAET